jgi:hypothetical protein
MREVGVFAANPSQRVAEARGDLAQRHGWAVL